MLTLCGPRASAGPVAPNGASRSPTEVATRHAYRVRRDDEQGAASPRPGAADNENWASCHGNPVLRLPASRFNKYRTIARTRRAHTDRSQQPIGRHHVNNKLKKIGARRRSPYWRSMASKHPGRHLRRSPRTCSRSRAAGWTLTRTVDRTARIRRNLLAASDRGVPKTPGSPGTR